MTADKLNSSYILTLPTIQNNDLGTYFIELQAKLFDEQEIEDETWQCWLDTSVYIYGDIWIKFFDEIACECITDYDFFGIENVSLKDCQQFQQVLFELSQKLSKVKMFDDLKDPQFISPKTQKCYFVADEGMTAITDPHANQQFIKNFIENFDSNIKLIINSFQNLAKWLGERENGMAFVGI